MRRTVTFCVTAIIFFLSAVKGGNMDVEDLDPGVQDYVTDEDYNDVFDATTNGTEIDATSSTKGGTLKFVRALNNMTRESGGVVNMRCEVVGDPPPKKIRWYKNEAPVEEEPGRVSIRKIHSQAHEHSAQNIAGSRLKITRLDVMDTGYYSCRANNDQDRIQSEAILQVKMVRYAGRPINAASDVGGSFSPMIPHFPDLLDGTAIGDKLDISGIGVSTPHISHLSPTNPFSDIFPPSPQPTSSQSSTVDLSSINGHFQLPHVPTSVGGSIPIRNEDKGGTCELYLGKVCADFVGNHSVYVPSTTTQKELEERLLQAFRVINYSNELSSTCERYAKPSLCFSAFAICRDQQAKYHQKPKNSEASTQLFNLLNANQGKIVSPDDTDGEDNLNDFTKTHGVMRRKRKAEYSSKFSFTLDSDGNFPSRKIGVETINVDARTAGRNRLNHKLRRICREECEILENELCRKEYVIAKRQKVISQVPLLECSDLPPDGTPEAADCLSLGISAVKDVQEDDRCYWGTGQSYRGVANHSAYGKPCLLWSQQLNVEISDYQELVGRHSYCRNPGSRESQPWCFVEGNTGMEVQFCNIPKCVENLWIYALVGVVLTSGFIVIIICYCCCYKSRKSRRQPNHLPSNKMLTGMQCDKNIYDGRRSTAQPMEMNSLLAGPGNITPGAGTLSSGSSRTSNNRVPQFSIHNVAFLQELGEGAFGKVYKGELQTGNKAEPTIFVAIKTLKENATPKTQSDFKREVDLMTDLRHPNIICLLGVILKGEPMCMLFEYMTQGDLHEFLICHSPRSDVPLNNGSGKVLEQPEFLHIALQIASGMEYLAGHHYVHRDLAARNCLVGENLTVKISDFGLSRDIYSSDYYRVQSKSLLPVRWMPPESILYGKFTTESDVWSYGVVLWEIYSYGLQPYYGYNNQEVIDMIRSRQLLPCPEDCPTMIYSLMIECWHEVANRRPQFPEIHHRLQNWYTNQTYLSDFCNESVTSYSGSSHKSTNKTNSTQLSAPIYKTDSLNRKESSSFKCNQEMQPLCNINDHNVPIKTMNPNVDSRQQNFNLQLANEQHAVATPLKTTNQSSYQNANSNVNLNEYNDKQCCSPKLSGAKKVLPPVHQSMIKSSPPNGTRPMQNGAQLVVRLPDPSKVTTETRVSK
ncbi:tyrosine-protein kinase transmembrane receptor Ror isoform X1 [Neodiprion virginianus]|uniref:tyrosine-protein kinase transmembrane receptor Ror isoform X1 n=1 Tax=Neodiprion virginianus TaxID=2961670 RepID=UPI001EE705A4|nr:tyrosine-protein kinase transmembrane receptor Ror isoform X1 [Neodiprion virginianus]